MECSGFFLSLVLIACAVLGLYLQSGARFAVRNGVYLYTCVCVCGQSRTQRTTLFEADHYLACRLLTQVLLQTHRRESSNSWAYNFSLSLNSVISNKTSGLQRNFRHILLKPGSQHFSKFWHVTFNVAIWNSPLHILYLLLIFLLKNGTV